MNEQKWLTTAVLLVAIAIAFVGFAIWRHTDYLYSQTPEAKAGEALLRDMQH